MMKRFYVANLAGDSGDSITLEGEIYRYIAVVMRKKIGEEFVLFNATDKIKVRLIYISKRQLKVEKICDLPRSLPSPCKIHLAQVILTGEKMDFCIQKATELGVMQITPLIAENFSKKIDMKRQAKKMEHWQKVILSACEQSNNDNIPILHNVECIDDWLKKTSFEKKIVLDFNGENWCNYVARNRHVTDVGLLVGAAGGLSVAERQMLVNANWQSINLGSRVLRGETASLAMLTLLQSQWGDLNL